MFLESQMYALDTLRDIVRTETDTTALLQEVAECLRYDVRHYAWVGVFLVEGQEVILQSFSGPEEPKHVRIPLNQSPYDEVTERGITVRVPDIQETDFDVVPFEGARSEVVVPIIDGGDKVGILQIVSGETNAFDDSDEEFLEEVAELLSTSVEATRY